MSEALRIPRKKAYCPLCGSFLCTGILGESIQVLCKGKDAQKCHTLIDINFTEKGVETTVVENKRMINE